MGLVGFLTWSAGGAPRAHRGGRGAGERGGRAAGQQGRAGSCGERTHAALNVRLCNLGLGELAVHVGSNPNAAQGTLLAQQHGGVEHGGRVQARPRGCQARVGVREGRRVSARAGQGWGRKGCAAGTGRR